MKEALVKINKQLREMFYKLTKLILRISAWLLGFASFWFPLVKIWTGIIDHNITVQAVLLYIVGGLIAWYFALAIDRVNKNLDKKD